MRSSFRAAVVALTLVAAVTGRVSAQGQKIAYVQSSVLLDQAPGRAAAESLFKKETIPVQEQIQRMSDSLQAIIDAFQKRQASLTAAQRDAQTKDIQSREAAYQARANDLQTKQQQRQNELVQPILDRVKLAIEDVRIEGGYSFIFNLDQGSPIVAFDKNLNLTDRVLAKLRSQPVTATKAPAPGAGAAPAGVVRPTPPLD